MTGSAYCIAVCLFLAIVSVVDARAEQAIGEVPHNPFSHPQLGAVAGNVQGQSLSFRPELRATLVSGTLSLANLAGRLIAIGEEIDGYLLVEVGEGEATFEKNGERVTLLVGGETGSDDD